MPATKRVKKERPPVQLEIEAAVNGRVGKATITVTDMAGKVVFTDKADLNSAVEMGKAANRIAAALDIKDVKGQKGLLALLKEKWHASIQERRRMRELAAAGSPEAAPLIAVELLDDQPETVRRPLCLAGEYAYAAAWCKLKTTITRNVNAEGKVTEYNPPLVKVEDCPIIVREDGLVFTDGQFPGARQLADLGLPVRLPATVPPGCAWSGAGVKRYLAGDYPDPAEVFRRLACVVDHFIDFARSLAPQETLSELVACYVLSTYLLEGFNVVGYLWPNGEPGSGKTTLLQVVTQTAYLGQLILSSSTLPTLRDMADYGATLAFDDAEAIMDVRRTDPDKRNLLLAGNRRGATVSVKELVGDRWETRHVDAFCPRLFSAIRLPDPVLGSRSIILPLVRSGDEAKSKRNPMDPEDWPTDRRRLVDDCWALALSNLHQLPEHDRQAARLARLTGRPLEPWRAILAVAHWLQERHGVKGLFKRMEDLSVKYQSERGDYEEHDKTRVLFRALLELTGGKAQDRPIDFKSGEIASVMNRIARDEELQADDGKDFTNANKVGWLMKRQRFEKGDRNEKAKTWKVTPAQIEAVARTYGVETQQKPGGESPAAEKGDAWEGD